MNIIVRYSGLVKLAVLQELVEDKFKKLQNLAAIAAARVTVQRQQGVKPAFRVLSRLEVPGPDFHAQASDHTVQAAVTKVVKNLEKQIRSRKNRQTDRWKTNLQLRHSPGPWSCGAAASRG
jgi:ribosomal subunit interface protein